MDRKQIIGLSIVGFILGICLSQLSFAPTGNSIQQSPGMGANTITLWKNEVVGRGYYDSLIYAGINPDHRVWTMNIGTIYHCEYIFESVFTVPIYVKKGDIIDVWGNLYMVEEVTESKVVLRLKDE